MGKISTSTDPIVLFLERRSDDPFDKDEMFKRMGELLAEYSFKVSVSGDRKAMLKFLQGIDDLEKKYS